MGKHRRPTPQRDISRRRIRVVVVLLLLFGVAAGSEQIAEHSLHSFMQKPPGMGGK